MQRNLHAGTSVISVCCLLLIICLLAGFASTASAVTVDITDFGAVGDGSTNDTSAIQDALDYLAGAGGGTLYVPAGTYLIDTVGTAWGSMGYCLTWTGTTTLTIQGDSSQASYFTLPTHQRTTIMLLLNQAEGDVTVTHVAFATPAPASHDYQGPAAISVGEMGDAQGNLHSITCSDVVFVYPSFAVHGQGAAHWYVGGCSLVVMGGAAYPNSYAEGITIGGWPSDNSPLETIVITGNNFYMDGTYDDHGVYLCLSCGSATITGNYFWARPHNDVIKLYGNNGTTLGDFYVNDNGIYAHNADTYAVVFAGGAYCDYLEVGNNTAYSGYSFLYSEWGPTSALISGNSASSYHKQAIYMNRGYACGVGGTMDCYGNAVYNYNVDADSQEGIILRRASTVVCRNNVGYPHDGSASGAFWNPYDVPAGGATAHDNVMTTSGSAPWYFTNDYSQAAGDYGNTWNDTYQYYILNGTRYNY